MCPPFTYLGCPLTYDRRKTDLLSQLVDKIKGRIEGWHNSILSPGGKLVLLLKHVLMVIPMYSLAASNPPKKVVKNIEKRFASFFWGRQIGMERRVWASWAALARPVGEGGMGLRRVLEVIDAFSVKLWWKLRKQSSLWSIYFKGRHFARRHPVRIRMRVGVGDGDLMCENWTGVGLMCWWAAGTQKGDKVLAVAIIWVLWKNMNNTRYEGAPFSEQQLIVEVSRQCAKDLVGRHTLVDELSDMLTGGTQVLGLYVGIVVAFVFTLV